MTCGYFTLPLPRLFAHRGSSGEFPENTLEAFYAAVDAGLNYLEMDVRATKDGHVVVHHDDNAQRTCGWDVNIAELSLNELKTLDAGYGFTTDRGRTYPFRGKSITIPTLQEVLAQLPNVCKNIEIKQATPPIEAQVVDLIRTTGSEKTVLLAAGDDEVMRRLRPLCKSIPTSMSFSELNVFFDWVDQGCPKGYVPPCKVLQIPPAYGDRTLATPRSVKAAHSVGLEMHIWTINDRLTMKRLLDMEVDGLMSDYPRRLLDAVEG